MTTKTKRRTALILKGKDSAEGIYIDGVLMVYSGFGPVTAWDILEALGYKILVEENAQLEYGKMPKKLSKQITSAPDFRTVT